MADTMKDTKILIADDDPNMQLAIKASLSRLGCDVTVVCNGLEASKILDREAFDAVISDQRMPEMTGQELLASMQKREINTPFIMITAHGTINQAVEAMQLGAADFITKPFGTEDLTRVIERVLSPESRIFRAKGKKTTAGRPIVTNDPTMIRVLEVAEAVAKSDATVLIQGESGTGKELIARLVHASSPRASQNFVAVNCAALPATLLESELFGHEKGSFTGAQQRKIGKFELAQGGTILLDEISEMELALQAKLLRVLQEREVDRVGGAGPISIDVRVLATTNRNLELMVNEGKFRADLFYRLNVIPLTLPALRNRKSDIGLLAEHFMRAYLGDKAPPLSSDVRQALEAHPWLGNVRELQNAVERAAILSGGRSPKQSDFMLTTKAVLRNEVTASIEPNAASDTNCASSEVQVAISNSEQLVLKAGTTVQEMEKNLILQTLKATSNNKTEAAQMLGISIRTLRNKLHEYSCELEV